MSGAADALMGIFGFKRVEGKQMKTDRELLELAARAAGIDGEYSKRANAIVHTGGYFMPLTNDSDALQLAVALKLDIQFFDGYSEIQVDSDGINSATVEPYAPDMQAATRRAIVRAAAAIGEAMK